ncbi:MAG: response regulator [Candidatus Thermoplasmatota archaeon]|nr:response regulator [Candidatus Thermoplasmatota archaeon]
MTDEKSEKMKVLFVDDDELLLTQTRIFLGKSDYDFEIDIARHVEGALQKIEDTEYDAIISDYKMQARDGLDLLRAIRKKDEDLPFIMFTGKGNEEVAQEALNLGADRYIRKRGDAKSQYDKLADALEDLIR